MGVTQGLFSPLNTCLDPTKSKFPVRRKITSDFFNLKNCKWGQILWFQISDLFKTCMKNTTKTPFQMGNVKCQVQNSILNYFLSVHVQYTGICLSKIGFYFLLVWLVMVRDVPISGGSTVSLFPCMWSSLNRGRSPTSLGRVTRSFSLKHSWKHI